MQKVTQILGLTDKELTKTSKELILLHKKVLRHYLQDQQDYTYREYKSFDYLYDNFIDEDNIAQYFHLPCQDFVKALVAHYKSLR